MKSYFVVAATVGLMASASGVDAASSHSHTSPALAANVCDGAKGLMLGAYYAFLAQHPECKHDLTTTGSLSSTSNGPASVAIIISDRRLKEAVELVDVLENGIRLYGYRYLGDARTFVGVMAQDLIEDERFAHAVHHGDDGFMRVDYAALGLEVADFEAMNGAGAKALQSALAA